MFAKQENSNEPVREPRLLDFAGLSLSIYIYMNIDIFLYVLLHIGSFITSVRYLEPVRQSRRFVHSDVCVVL